MRRPAIPALSQAPSPHPNRPAPTTHTRTHQRRDDGRACGHVNAGRQRPRRKHDFAEVALEEALHQRLPAGQVAGVVGREASDECRDELLADRLWLLGTA
eukprot:358380-Chlamydomonas_euryale.AAC.4